MTSREPISPAVAVHKGEQMAMDNPDRTQSARLLRNDLNAHLLFVWALFALNALLIVISYWRLPSSELYHVSERGLAGGLGRALVFANFPTAIIALAMIGLAAHRLREVGPGAGIRSRKAIATVATLGALLCLVTAIPGVVDQADLDARPVNALPALGVAIALGLTLLSLRAPGRFRELPWTGRDRLALAVVAVLAIISLPWILADAGFYVDDIPIVERVLMSKEIPEGATLRAVHLGHHHGMDGFLLAVSAFVLGRAVRCDLTSRIASVLRGYLSLMFSYGLLNLLEDAWLEQVVKRGWADRELPDFLVPELSIGWAMIVIGAIAVWYFHFCPIECERP